MKYLLPFALVLAMPSVVSARGCYVSYMLDDLEMYLAGGMTEQEAISAITESENFDGTRKCFIKLKGFSKQVKTVRPYSYRALWGE